MPYPITKRVDPTPKAAPGDLVPSEAFLKKVQDAYSQLPDEVKQLLREKGYTITVSNKPWLDGEIHSFGYTDNKEHTIHVSETAVDDDGNVIYVENFYKETKDLVTHEVGHALDAILGLTADQDFVEAWKKDIDYLNQDNFLKEFKGGDGGGRLAFTNEQLQDGVPKGALETAAELMSRILGSKGEVSEHVMNAAENTYKYLKGKMLW